MWVALNWRAAAMASLLLWSPAAGAQQRDWLVSGAELLMALKGNLPFEAGDAEQRRMLSSTRASAYIVGVIDYTRAIPRCQRAPMLPHEMNDRVHTFLTALPPARLEENAARLVVEALPC